MFSVAISSFLDVHRSSVTVQSMYSGFNAFITWTIHENVRSDWPVFDYQSAFSFRGVWGLSLHQGHQLWHCLMLLDNPNTRLWLSLGHWKHPFIVYSWTVIVFLFVNHLVFWPRKNFGRQSLESGLRSVLPNAEDMIFLLYKSTKRSISPTSLCDNKVQ